MIALAGCRLPAWSETLSATRLGVLYSASDPAAVRTARYYATRRGIPARNLIALDVPDQPVIDRQALRALRERALRLLPASVQSVVLIWRQPYAVECMSITTAVAAGFNDEFCSATCQRTSLNPLFDTPGWLPMDTTGWLPAMLLPSGDETLARALIERGVAADATRPPGTAYLISTSDSARNVRAAGYQDVVLVVNGRIAVKPMSTPVAGADDAIAYFTGAARVEELPRIHFRPGAAADHLTSLGGVLDGETQMPALAWLRQGATASYGAVSEPCNFRGKFPSPAVYLDHVLRGDSLLEAYWKSVAMPGQGLFIGEPLARPFATPR